MSRRRRSSGLESEALERAILAALLLEPKLRQELPAELPSWLVLDRHRRILAALLATDSPNLRTVEALLRERGELEDAGGVAYLATLDVDLPDIKAFSAYLDHLQALASRRRIVEDLVPRLERAAQQGEASLLDVAAEISLAASAAAEPGLASVQPVRLSDVEPEEVRFLWRPYIPLGKLTILEGDPGIGKSWITAALATALSLGRGLPDVGEFTPRRVLMLSAEDGLADTLVPRLEAMEADRSRIDAWPEPINLSVPAGVGLLDRLIGTSAPGLVVIDPLVAYVGARTDTYRPNEVRGVLSPVAAVAERHSCAILVVLHLNKSTGDRAIYRGQGSIDFLACVRSVLLAGVSSDDDSRRALVHLKCNVAPKGPAQGFTLEQGAFGWTGESKLGAGDLLASEAGPEDRSALVAAEEFLLETLGDGPIETQELKREAKREGHAWRTVERARRRLEIQSRKTGGRGSPWVWELIAEDREDTDSKAANTAKKPKEENVAALAAFAGDGRPSADDRQRGDGRSDELHEVEL